MILNNCTTCWRKPSILYYGPDSPDGGRRYALCLCGKEVSPIWPNWWTAEVAADMWNRANPVEEEVKLDYLNYLAAEICKAGLSVCFDENGDMLLTGKVKTPAPYLAMECIKYRNDLTEFYKKRLKPGVKV